MLRTTTIGTLLAGAWILGAGPVQAQHPEEEAVRRALEAARVQLLSTEQGALRLQQRELRAVEEALRATRRAQERMAVVPRGSLEAELRAVEALAPRLELERSRVLAAREALAVREALASPRVPRRLDYDFTTRAPEPWLQQDPADSLYRAAREALNAGRYAQAASRFAQLRGDYPRSGYAGDAYYFQALALYRQGGSTRLDQARELLAEQLARHADARTTEDARSLQIRIQSELARRGDSRAAADLAQEASAGCEDEDGIRATALSALLQMDSEQAMPILREVLRDRRDECSAELRRRAVFLVAQHMTDETVDILVDLAVDDPDPDVEVRKAAVFWLSQVDSDEAVNALLGILGGSETHPEIQERAVFALGQHGSERAAQALRDFARNPQAPAELRSNAIFWLGQRGGAEASSFLRGLWSSLDDPELKERVLFSVAQGRSDENQAWLLARARDAGEDLEIRKKALFWAGQAGIPPEEALEIYRASSDREMKEQALFVLTQVRDDREVAVDALMEIARNEEDEDLQKRAVFWLGQSKDPRVADFLLELIRGGGGA